MFHSLVWNRPATGKELFLTFDDGPHPEATPFVLDKLKQYGAKASFFCLGKNVAAYSGIFERIFDEGHTIGNHTFSHLNGWSTSDKKYFSDIEKAAQLIDSNFFRPPYGRITPFQIKFLRDEMRRLPSNIIMWSLLSGDFDTKLSPEKCFENVLLHAKSGDIIVFHDSSKAWDRMSYALPKVLEHFSREGFSFRRL